MKYILLAFVILTVFVGMQHAAAQNTGNTAENNCPVDYDYVQIKDNTSLSSYMIDLKYGPPVIKLGCEIEWHINFLNPRNESEFLENVQYDIILDASDDDDPYIPQSLAAEEGTQFLYSTSGQQSLNAAWMPTKTVKITNASKMYFIVSVRHVCFNALR